MFSPHSSWQHSAALHIMTQYPTQTPSSNNAHMVPPFSPPAMPTLHASTHAHPKYDMSQCHRYAQFLAPLAKHGWLMLFLFVVFFFGSLLMTQLTRALTFPPTPAPTTTTTTAVQAQNETATTSTGGESTSIPATDVEAGLLGGEGEQPPPYQPSASGRENPTYAVPEIQPFSGTSAPARNTQSTTAPAPSTTTAAAQTAPTPPTVKLSSAHLFVLGSVYISFNLFCLTFLALLIQTILFCVWGRLGDTPTTVFYWALFSGPAIFSMFGVTCWAMLFRDLFGKRISKKYPFPEYFLLKWVSIVVFSPLIGIAIFATMLGQGCIAALEKCQGRWCPDAVDEEGEELNGDADVGREEIGLEMGNRDAGTEGEVEAEGENEGGGSQVRDEERVGLIRGVEKS